MPLNFDALRQIERNQFLADLEVEKQKPPTISDYARTFGVGVADIPASVGEGLSLLGLEKIGGVVRGVGEGAQTSLVEGMTIGGRRAATAPILESDTPIATTALKVSQALPGVAAMAIPGALAVRGIGAVGKAAGIARLAPQVLETGASLPSKIATGLGFGASEGVYSGLSNAAQTRSEIMAQDIKILENNPLYQKHFSTLDSSLAPADREQLAREAASREAEKDVFVKTALTTGVISAAGGGGVFAALARPTGGVGREFTKGLVREAVTEAPQSALEAIHQNVALNRPVTEGALTAGVEGGLIGGILGGGIGGVNAAFAVPGTTQADINANVPLVAAPPVLNVPQPVPPTGVFPAIAASTGVPVVLPQPVSFERPDSTILEDSIAARAALAVKLAAVKAEVAADRLATKVEIASAYTKKGLYPPPVLGEVTGDLYPRGLGIDTADVDTYLRSFGGRFPGEPPQAPYIPIEGAQPPGLVPAEAPFGLPVPSLGGFGFDPGVNTRFPVIQEVPPRSSFPTIGPTSAPAIAAVAPPLGLPRSADSTKLPVGIRGKTWDEIQAVLATATYQPATIRKIDAELARQGLRAATDEYNRLQEVANATQARQGGESNLLQYQGTREVRPPAEASSGDRTKSIAEIQEAQITGTRNLAVAGSVIGPLEGEFRRNVTAEEMRAKVKETKDLLKKLQLGADEALKSNLLAQKRRINKSLEAPGELQINIPDYVAVPHRAEYQALTQEFAEEGLPVQVAEASLAANYHKSTGFDVDEVRADITTARLGQVTFEQQIDALVAKPRRGRPTTEQQAEHKAINTAKSAPASVISDPDPDIQENARDIVANSEKLAQLRRMATEPGAHPLTVRLKKAVDELLAYAGTPNLVVPPDVLFQTSSRPEAFGPDYLAEDEDITAWQQMLSELRAVGVERDEAKAILKDHYTPLTGFDFERFSQTLQARTVQAGQVAEVRLSRELSSGAAAQKVADVLTVVNRVSKQWKTIPFGGIEVHETLTSLQQDLQKEVYAKGAQHEVRGVYDPATKTVHLIAAHLTTPEEAEFVLFHEMLGHFGLRGVFGGNFGVTMRELYRQNQNLRLAANALMKEFNYDLETATEEALADLAGRNLPIKGFATLLAKIQKALRAIGLDSVANWLEGRTNAEVLNVIAQAKLFVTEGKGALHLYTPETSKLLYSYAGVRATFANQGARAAAEQFEMLGIPMKQIRATTGWFKGMEDKWRFEISDQGATLTPDPDNARTIGEVLDHPVLFTNYPTLRDVPFGWQDLPSYNQAKVTTFGRIIVNTRLNDAAALSAILHELQHIIQGVEEFARGGTATTPEVVEAASKAGGTPAALFEVYQHLVGEIEARDVQSRALMTDEERAVNTPYTSEALTRAPILRFDGGSTALTAYHASPHTFDKFSTAYGGTGEGNNAFGWGLYFTDSEEVLDYYFRVAKRTIVNQKYFAEDPALVPARSAQRYKVDLAPKEDEYLDWDKKISEQSEKIRAVLLAAADLTKPGTGIARFIKQNGTGRALYTYLASNIFKIPGYENAPENPGGNPNLASGYLLSIGIRGNKYLDAVSRRKGKGSYNYVLFDEADVSIKARFSRAGQDAAEDLSGQVAEFYNFSAPFQRAFRKLATFGSKSSSARAIRLALSKSIVSPYHLATSKKADGTLQSKGFANLFQNVLRPKQQFSDYIMSYLQEPIEKTWVKGQGLGKPPIEFEAAARAIFAHNDSGVTTAEFFNDPKYAAALNPKARELYAQVRETMKRGLMAEFTAKATRMHEVIDDPNIYAEAIQELHTLVQARIDSGFIPNRRSGEYAIGAYRAGELMQWYTFESIGEAQAAAKELRVLFQGSDISLDIDTVGNGQPSTVERAVGDYYSTSSYWDFLQQARTAGVALTKEEKGRLAQLMIRSESMLQNRIQRRKGVPGYSKDLMRTIGEFVTSTGFSVADTQMSARTASAMNQHFVLSEVEVAELKRLQDREDFKPLAAASESRVYETLTQEPDLMKRFEALTAYSRMKYLEAAGGQFWAQDGVDKGAYRDRANELIAFLKAPKSGGVSGALRTVAALHFLGGSAAAAIVNLSSLPMFAAPYLHQFIGVKAYPLITKHFKNFSVNAALRDLSRLTAALDPQQRGSGQAAKDWNSLEHLGEELLTAVQRASEEGIISDSQIHEMFGFSRGGLLAHSGAVRKSISAWMAPFRLTEQANRFSTFMAAFEVGQKGISDGSGGMKKLTGAALYDFARDAVDQTQAIYGPINRQPWARTPIGHALFTFRAFPLMMGELFLRLPAPQRTLALGSLVLAAGINGIPFVDDLRDIIDTIAQRVFGSPLNTRRLMTNMAAQASEAAFGTDLSQLIMNGSLDAMTGASISGRIGFGNLIPGTRIGAAGEDFFERTLADIAGPVGAEVQAYVKAFQGQPSAALPSAVRNVGRAVEAARYGKITDYKGQTLIDDVTAGETFMQGLGFTSGRLSQAYETQRGALQEQAYVDEIKQGFLNDIRIAVAHSDAEGLADVREEADAWNEMHPQYPIILRPNQLRNTLRLAGLPLSERILKQLPRAWRIQSLN